MPSQAQRYRYATAYQPQRPSYGGGGGGGTLIDLIMARGDQQAEAARASGELWGNTLASVGQNIAGAITQHAEEKKVKAQHEAFSKALGSWDGSDPQKLYGSLTMLDPKARMEVVTGAVALRDLSDKADAKDQERFQTVLKTAANLPYGMFAKAYPAMYPKMSAGAERFLGVPADQIPAEPSEEVYKAIRSMAGVKPAPLTEVSPNATLYNPETKAAEFTAPAKPPDPPAVGSFEDYVVRRFGDKPTPDQITQARKAYNQADDRALRPQIVIMPNQAGELVAIDKGAVAAGRPGVTPIRDGSGAGIGQAPTAEARNRAGATARAQPVLDSVAELSEKINTQNGVIAKIAGAAERAKATANLSDDVAEYQALVSGFTPMLARIVGHSGVLTEQDVQSVRAMLPSPDDSKSMRDRKVARIKKILAGEGAAAPAPAATADPLGLR